jgi:hypothetical protein
VADLEPAGVICRYEKVSELKAGSWLTVERTHLLNYKEYDGKEYADPLIEVTKVEPAEEVEGTSSLEPKIKQIMKGTSSVKRDVPFIIFKIVIF